MVPLGRSYSGSFLDFFTVKREFSVKAGHEQRGFSAATLKHIVHYHYMASDQL